MNSINMEKRKIKIKSVGSEDKYNHVTLEKSEFFLNNLQDFVVDIGLTKVKPGEYEDEGKSYDLHTYYTLFYEDPNQNFKIRKLTIDEFSDGTILRYFNEDIELLIIFLVNEIEIIFYCDLNNRGKIMDSLLKFCEIEKIKSK